MKPTARARRFTLRVSRVTGRVSLSMPIYADPGEAQGFLGDREGWIRSQLQKAPPPQWPEIGATVPVEGRALPILEGPGRSVRIEEGAILLPKSRDAGPAVAVFLKEMARDRLASAVTLHAQRLGRGFGRITLRDTRSRWGSCSSKGDLMFNWRLIMAPPEVLDYVAAHEVAHLAVMNHSPAFWATCGELCPGYEGPRRWLKTHGAELLAWRFDRLP